MIGAGRILSICSSHSRHPLSRGPRTRESSPVMNRQAELLDPVTDLVTIQAEQVSSPRLVAASAVERLHDKLPFHVFQVHTITWKPKRQRPPGTHHWRDGIRDDPVAVHQHHRALNHVPQLTDVSWP